MATLAPPRIEVGDLDYASFYDSIYRNAAGDPSAVPWADEVANPALVAWLNYVAPTLVRCGSRVAVVGCGLGEDARELIHRGFDVTAFDISPGAVQWARKNDAANAASYQVADLFNPPSRWRHRFDLVVEIYTLQSLLPGDRSRAMKSLRELLGPHGCLLAICTGATESVALEEGPPWPLTEEELRDSAAEAGLNVFGEIDAFLDDETPPKLRLRGVFRRSR